MRLTCFFFFFTSGQLDGFTITFHVCSQAQHQEYLREQPIESVHRYPHYCMILSRQQSHTKDTEFLKRDQWGSVAQLWWQAFCPAFKRGHLGLRHPVAQPSSFHWTELSATKSIILSCTNFNWTSTVLDEQIMTHSHNSPSPWNFSNVGLVLAISDDLKRCLCAYQSKHQWTQTGNVYVMTTHLYRCAVLAN